MQKSLANKASLVGGRRRQGMVRDIQMLFYIHLQQFWYFHGQGDNSKGVYNNGNMHRSTHNWECWPKTEIKWKNKKCKKYTGEDRVRRQCGDYSWSGKNFPDNAKCLITVWQSRCGMVERSNDRLSMLKFKNTFLKPSAHGWCRRQHEGKRWSSAIYADVQKSLAEKATLVGRSRGEGMVRDKQMSFHTHL